MGLAHSPKIITDGLIMCVDAANPKSYPGSGSTWYDISGKGNHITLYNTPTFASNVFQFNGVDQYAENALNLATGTSTVMVGSRYSGSTLGRVTTSKVNNWFLGHHGTVTEVFYANGSVSSGGPSDTNWRIYAGTHDVTNDLYNFYIDGVFKVGNNGGAAGPNGFSLGRWAPTNIEYSTCEISFLLAYNRVLTADEVRQNYSTLRGRFGI